MAATTALALALLACSSMHAVRAQEVKPAADVNVQQVNTLEQPTGGARALRTCCACPSPPYYSPPTWSSPPTYNPPSSYYSPPYYSWDTFPYTHDCYFESTGVYTIKPKGAYFISHDYTRYCFWVEAKQPDQYSHEKCRNFDLWSINFRVEHSCENQVTDLSWDGQSLSPVWAQNLPSGKSMLQITWGGNKVLDTQQNIYYHKKEVCFTLPNWCPLDKFCKGDHCKAAFYPSPYSNLQCCPSWEFGSKYYQA